MKLLTSLTLGFALMSSSFAGEKKQTTAEHLQNVSVTIRAESGYSAGEGSGVVFTRKDSKGNLVNFVWTAGHVIDNLRQFSDGTLTVLNSNFVPMSYIKFKDLFPVSLSTLEFTAGETDYSYFTATVTFKYLIYEILDTKFKVKTSSITT